VGEATLRLTVRTPREVVVDDRVLSVRIRTDTGQVGLRPNSEPAVMVVEPGLVLVRMVGEERFLATAGGLLRCDGSRAILLTPLAVLGKTSAEVKARLEEAFRKPNAELELRTVLQRLETGLLRELRRSPTAQRRDEPSHVDP